MKTQNPFTGRSKGSLANVTATTYKGQNVLKSKPLQVANPQTPGQVAQRTLFNEVLKTARQLLPLIRIAFKENATTKSEYNCFMSENLVAAKAAGSYSNLLSNFDLIVAKGTIGKVVDATIETTGGTDMIIRWANNSDGSTSLHSDKMAFVAVAPDGNVKKAEITTKTRDNTSHVVPGLQDLWEAGFCVYVYFVRPSEGKASDSTNAIEI